MIGHPLLHDPRMQIYGEWTHLWCAICKKDLDWIRTPTMQEVYENMATTSRN